MELFRRPSSKYYQARFHIGERCVRVSTGKVDEQAALHEAIRIQTRMEMNAHRGIRPGVPTVATVFKTWIRKFEGAKQLEHVWRYQRHIEDGFGEHKITQVTAHEVEQSIAHLGLVQRNMVRGLWRRIFEQAHESGVDVETPSFKKERHEFDPRPAFTQSEVDLIIDHLRERRGSGRKRISQDVNTLLYYYVVLLAATGMRPGSEALSLQYFNMIEDRSPDNKRIIKFQIRAETTKVRKERWALLDTWAFDIIYRDLSMWHVSNYVIGRWGQAAFLFSDRNGRVPVALHQAFKEALERTGLLKDLLGRERVLYSLRHFYITKKLEQGKPIFAIAKQCGNSVAIIEKSYDQTIAANMASQLVD